MNTENNVCPSCSRRVINRRLPQCEFCGTDLPHDLLMSPQELEEADARARAKEREERQRRSAERAAREARRRRGGTLPGGGGFPI